MKNNNMKTLDQNKSKPRTNGYKLFLSLFLGIFLLITTTVSIVKIPLLANYFALNTMTANTYYKNVEDLNSFAAIEVISGTYNRILSFYNPSNQKKLSHSIDVSLSFEDAFLGKTKTSNLDSFEAKIVSNSDSTSGTARLYLSANDSSLATLNGLFDYSNSSIYLQILELSSSFVKLPSHLVNTNIFSSSNSGFLAPSPTENLQNLFKNPTLSADELNRILKRYTKVITKELSSIEDLTLSKNQTLIVNGLEESTTKITLPLSKNELYNIVEAILKSAKEDTVLMKLCNDMNLCPEASYRATIEMITTVLASFQDKSKNDKNLLEISLWVNKLGIITSREITYTSDPSVSMGYAVVANEKTIGLELWCASPFLQIDKKQPATVSLTSAKTNYEYSSLPSSEDMIYNLDTQSDGFAYLEEAELQMFLDNICTTLRIQLPADLSNQFYLILHKFYN